MPIGIKNSVLYVLYVLHINGKRYAKEKKDLYRVGTSVTDSLLKRLGYHEHCVYSERICYCPNLYRPIKWYVYAKNCIGLSYFRQNLYIHRYIFGHKCIFKTKGSTILSAHRTQIFTECPTPYRGLTS